MAILMPWVSFGNIHMQPDQAPQRSLKAALLVTHFGAFRRPSLVTRPRNTQQASPYSEIRANDQFLSFTRPVPDRS